MSPHRFFFHYFLVLFGCWYGCGSFSLSQHHPAMRHAVPLSTTTTTTTTSRYNGFFDGILSNLKERSREVTVQHVLLSTKEEAVAVYEELFADDGSGNSSSSNSMARLAQTKSLCGSGKKRPDANLAQLRGAPGELQFRKGQMVPLFEKIAFEAPLRVVQPPFRTQEGWHVMIVNQRTGDTEETVATVANKNENKNNDIKNAAATAAASSAANNKNKNENNAVASTKKTRGKSKKRKKK